MATSNCCSSQKLGPLNERQREVMQDMFSSGQRLQHFIQDFLTYSVLETGELRMQLEQADMNACLSEVCRLWSGHFQERGLALYFLANDKLTPFAVDAAKIQRIISNLLDNASKYTPQGGTVWLHAEPYMWERRSASKPVGTRERRRQALGIPNAVKVSVSDTGPGQSAGVSYGDFRRFLPPARQRSGGRHGARIGHSPPAITEHGREDLGRKRAGSGLQVLLSASAETRFE